jgi:hypothetical protein
MGGKRLILAGFAAWVAALAMLVGASVASAGNAGGNSAAAKACQKGKWASLYTSTGGTFTSQAECVAYSAQGGTLVTSPAAADCAAVGGTYSTDPLTDAVASSTSPVYWTCNGGGPITDYVAQVAPLVGDCLAMTNGVYGWSDTAGPLLFTCYNGS